MSVIMNKIPDEKRANKEIINFRNKDGWELYKAATDKVADTITEIAKDKSLTIDEVREKICKIDETIQKECFGTVGIKPNRNPRHKRKSVFYFAQRLRLTQELHNFRRGHERFRSGRCHCYGRSNPKHDGRKFRSS